MKEREDVHFDAHIRFDTWELCKCLTRAPDGEVIVDRSIAIKNDDDERLFYVMLNDEYRWWYNNFEEHTVYFTVEDGVFYGGLYRMGVGRLNKRVAALVRPCGVTRAYACSRERMDELIERVTMASYTDIC